jgi:hypothetical protein
MYQKPALQRYGDLRALTLVGSGADGDGGVFGSGYLNGACDGGLEDILGTGCRS